MCPTRSCTRRKRDKVWPKECGPSPTSKQQWVLADGRRPQTTDVDQVSVAGQLVTETTPTTEEGTHNPQWMGSLKCGDMPCRGCGIRNPTLRIPSYNHPQCPSPSGKGGTSKKRCHLCQRKHKPIIPSRTTILKNQCNLRFK